MKRNQHITNLDSSGKDRLKYILPDTILLDLPFILTYDKKLRVGKPYLKIEYWLADSRIQGVRITTPHASTIGSQI
jgi:hypothetical protein